MDDSLISQYNNFLSIFSIQYHSFQNYHLAIIDVKHIYSIITVLNRSVILRITYLLLYIKHITWNVYMQLLHVIIITYYYCPASRTHAIRNFAPLATLGASRLGNLRPTVPNFRCNLSYLLTSLFVYIELMIPKLRNMYKLPR